MQSASADPQTPTASFSATYATAQRAADLNVVIISWGDTTAMVTSVTDTAGNVYQLAVGPTTAGTNATQSIYYAMNIAAAAAGNTVTVAFSGPADFPDLRILEYSGIDSLMPLDGAIGSSGNSDTSSSGSITTTHPATFWWRATTSP